MTKLFKIIIGLVVVIVLIFGMFWYVKRNKMGEVALQNNARDIKNMSNLQGETQVTDSSWASYRYDTAFGGISGSDQLTFWYPKEWVMKDPSNGSSIIGLDSKQVRPCAQDDGGPHLICTQTATLIIERKPNTTVDKIIANETTLMPGTLKKFTSNGVSWTTFTVSGWGTYPHWTTQNNNDVIDVTTDDQSYTVIGTDIEKIVRSFKISH